MDLNSFTETILGAAYEVYNVLGYGFSEKVYENALELELRSRGVSLGRQITLVVKYKGRPVGTYKADMVVERCVTVELKTGAAIHEEHFRQCLNYLKASDLRLGLVLNFGPAGVDKRRVVNGDPVVR